jgi:hypothetical protein
MTRPTIAAVEPEFAQVVAEGLRRHRRGARLTIDRIAELGGLHDALPTRDAIALLSAATTHDMWYELVHAHKLSWDETEQTLYDGLARALLNPNCAT